MLRLETKYWYGKDIFGISESCVLLLNMVIVINSETTFVADMEIYFFLFIVWRLYRNNYGDLNYTLNSEGGSECTCEA